jgi:hypothetical protein
MHFKSAQRRSVAARFYYPRGTVVAGSSLFVCDAGNHTVRMVK